MLVTNQGNLSSLFLLFYKVFDSLNFKKKNIFVNAAKYFKPFF